MEVFMTTAVTQARAPTLFDKVVAATPGNCHLEKCIQCGTCGGSCPSGADMDHTPRALFALINAGMKDVVYKSNTPWYCVSCYYCTVRCPQQVHITDIMYTLKRLAVQEGHFDDASAPDFSKTFINWVESFGRSFELGLMGQYRIMHNPFGVFKIAGMGIGMVSKGRLDFTPTRIKGLDGLKAILKKAKELEVVE
jgi:heterodisulfide reductase subunit C